ncbi:MAG: hypothetical protein EOP56_00775 [Sphingobacteriales bacterium]|nr:MAG: hypothetical protein EOP56_00775 [Sphingobacteriales bacterium]
MTSNDKPILLLAETGFIIRNLLLGYFAGEVSRCRKLLVAVQQPNDPELLKLIEGKNIELIDFPFEPYYKEQTNLQRLLSWDNVIYNAKLVAKDNNSLRLQTRLFEGASATGKFARVNNFFQACGKATRAIGLANAIEDIYLEKYIGKKPVVNEWEGLLKKYDPAVVFSSMLTHSVRYRSSTDLPIMVAAHRLGIKTCTLVQSWDNLSSKTCVLPQWLDRYYTWSDSMSAELLKYNPRVNAGRVKVVGSPQYDFHLDESLIQPRTDYLSNLGLDSARPYILIGTGTARWMPDEMEKMINLCLALHRQMPEVQCVIRLHPKDPGERWQPYRQTMKENGIALQYTSPKTHMDRGGFVPPKDFYRDQVNVIYHSEVVINSSSSITVDAAILQRPVICIAYDLYDDELFPEGRSLTYSQSAHYSKLTATGGVKVVYSETDCVNAIEAYLKDPQMHKEERKKIVDTVAADVSKKAGITLAHEVLQLADIQS